MSDECFRLPGREDQIGPVSYGAYGVHYTYGLLGSVFAFSRAAVTEYHKRGGLDSKRLLSHGPGGQESEIRASTWLVPSEGFEGESVPRFSPGF